MTDTDTDSDVVAITQLVNLYGPVIRSSAKRSRR
jgi:hypothetical protein